MRVDLTPAMVLMIVTGLLGYYLGSSYTSIRQQSIQSKQLFDYVDTIYTIAVLLRRDKPDDALRWADGALKTSLPAVDKAFAEEGFELEPHSRRRGPLNLEQKILEYFILFPPKAVQLPSGFFTSQSNMPPSNIDEMEGVLLKSKENDSKVFDLIERYKRLKQTENLKQ